MTKAVKKKAVGKKPRFDLAAQVRELGADSLLPPAKPPRQVKAKDDLKPLLYFVHERESIRMMKVEGNPPPYTDDPILGTYRFCNVRRGDDRVSSWLKENVLTEKNIKADLKGFLMFSALGRWINWPPTLQLIMRSGLYPTKKIDWKKIGKLIDDVSKKGKAWTGAYMIRAPKKKGLKKGKYVAETVVGKNLGKVVDILADYFTITPPAERSYQAVHAMLMGIHGYGSFMAGQIAGDWTYTSLLSQAYDLKTWAPMGPGSVRGFNRLTTGKKAGRKPPEELWLKKLGEWRAAVVKRMGERYEDLTALDIQNCLCETDKLLRVQQGEGRPRAKYSAHTY